MLLGFNFTGSGATPTTNPPTITSLSVQVTPTNRQTQPRNRPILPSPALSPELVTGSGLRIEYRENVLTV